MGDSLADILSFGPALHVMDTDCRVQCRLSNDPRQGGTSQSVHLPRHPRTLDKGHAARMAIRLRA